MATRFDVTQGGTRSMTRRGHTAMTAHMRVVLIVLAGLPLAACGFYSADEITAHVVDAETRAPLEGVHVVAAWEVKGGLEGGNVLGYVKVMEAVTNKDGTFHFPSWGPKPNMHFGGILSEAPQLLFFKSGYRFHTVANGGSLWTRAPSVMKSDWNGKTITLQPFKGTPAEYKRSFDMLHVYVGGLDTWGDHWPEMPKFICTLAYQDEALTVQGVPNALYPLSLLRDRGVNCKRSDDASEDRK